MDILLSITNSIIGLSLLFQLLLFWQHLTKSKEYQLLADVTQKLRGNINYSLDCSLRSLWSTLYQWQDEIMDVKPVNINYFNH